MSKVKPAIRKVYQPPSDSPLIKATRELEDLVAQCKANDDEVAQLHDRLTANNTERKLVEKHLIEKLETLHNQRRVIDAMCQNAQAVVAQLTPRSGSQVGLLGDCQAQSRPY